MSLYSRCQAWELDGTWERLSTAISAEAQAAGAIEWIVARLPGTRGSAVAEQKPERGFARHQVQGIGMHTYDAQLTVGEPASLPVEVALDGVEENLDGRSRPELPAAVGG